MLHYYVDSSAQGECMKKSQKHSSGSGNHSSIFCWLWEERFYGDGHLGANQLVWLKESCVEESQWHIADLTVLRLSYSFFCQLFWKQKGKRRMCRILLPETGCIELFIIVLQNRRGRNRETWPNYFQGFWDTNLIILVFCGFAHWSMKSFSYMCLSKCFYFRLFIELYYCGRCAFHIALN